jgi:hypothetical protein
MAAVTTERLMEIALELVGWDAAPPDCEIYYAGTRISHVLMGLEIGAAELFIARQLGYHAAVSYIPAGHTGPFWEVYRRHADQMIAAGVPEDEAEAVVGAGIADLRLRWQAEITDRVASVARLLEMPFLTVHSPIDEQSRELMRQEVDTALASHPDATVGTIRDALAAMDAFAAADTDILLALGAWDAPAGRVVLSHGAYASGGYEVARAYFAHGVGTLCCADIAPEDVRRLAADALGGNLLVLGRAAVANVGMAPYLARLRHEGLEVTPWAGVTESNA